MWNVKNQENYHKSHKKVKILEARIDSIWYQISRCQRQILKLGSEYTASTEIRTNIYTRP